MTPVIILFYRYALLLGFSVFDMTINDSDVYFKK